MVICKSFLCKIWGCSILLCGNLWGFSPSKVSRYTVWPLVDVEIYVMYFLSWQSTAAIWLIQRMVNQTAKFRQKATYSCNTGYNLVGDSNHERSEISSGTNFWLKWCSVPEWQTSICVNIYLLFLPIAPYNMMVLASKSFATLLLDAKLIVRLKNKTMLEISTCGMSPPTVLCVLVSLSWGSAEWWH